MEYTTTPIVIFAKDLGEILNNTAEIDDEFGGGNSTWFPNVTAAALSARSRQSSYIFQYRVVPSFFLVLCVVGLIGNGVVIKVLWSIMAKNVMKSVTDILVINLAVADFIFVGSLPFWVTELFLEKSWVFGTVGCKLMSFITLLNLYGSVFFLVAMGIDRYLAVVYAVRARNYRTPRKAVIASAIIWAFASLIGLQALIWRRLQVKPTKTRCVWDLPDGFITTYYVIRMGFGFFVPFFVIVYCYILIILKLHSRVNRSSRLTGSSMTKKQQKITRAILAVISLFVVCWLPNHIVTLIFAVTVNNPTARSGMDLGTANLVSACLAYANSSINPILYAFMKEEIRQEGTEMIVKFFTCCKKSGSNIGRSSGLSKSRGLKLSFWRSTRHTMLAVVPRHSHAEIEIKMPEKQEESSKNGQDSLINQDDEKKSENSVSSFPTTPGVTLLHNGNPHFDAFNSGNGGNTKVDLVVKMDDI